ncbi:MAG: PAS domain S-box protein [Candidatus Neomarinimicrobiota bacterium]
MAKIKILLVESEIETARETGSILKNLGYNVVKTTNSGPAALTDAADLKPDLVLMGISLKSEMNGITTSVKIHRNLNIPIVFLIGQDDRQHIERLKQTEHDGYIFKPPVEAELYCIIELALSRHKMESLMKENQALLSTTLKSIGDAVITTDQVGKITFLNPVAEKLTGWSLKDAIARPLPEVFNIVNEQTNIPAPNPVKTILEKGVVTALANHTVLISRSGLRIPIDDSGAPIKNDNGNIMGAVLVFRDITERKQAEEALERERNLLKTVINNIPDKIYAKDTEGRFIICNKAVAARMGVSDPNTVVGKSDFDFLPPELAAQFHANEQEIIQSGQSLLNHEEPLDQLSGGVRWNSATKVPLRDAQGNIIGIVGVGRDITERKRIEDALKKSEERYRKQFEEAIDAIFIADAETGILIDCNRSALELIGREKSELIGQHQRILHPPTEIEGEMSRTYRQHITGKEGQILETQVITRSGQIKDVAVKASIFEIEGQKVLQGLFRDVTERKRAEEALSKERNLLRTVIDNVPDKIYAKDTEGRFIICNKAMAERMGKSNPDELIGKSDFDFLPPELAAQFHANEQEIIQSGKAIINHEEPLDQLSGGVKWNSATKVPLRDEQGNIIGIVGVGRDITESKRMEESLRKEKALMDALMDNLPDSIYFKDRQCRMFRVSRKVIDDVGKEHIGQIIGQTDIDLFGEEFGRETVNKDIHLMTTGEPIIGLVESRQLKDGSLNWTSTTKVPLRDADGQITGLVGITREINEIKKAEEQREKVILELQEAINKINTLKGLLPICANCKKIRDDKGYWNNVETYIHSHADVEFTHGICPDCMKKLYPDFYNKKMKCQE